MANVKINYGHLKDISESYNGCSYNSAISYIDELVGICDQIEEEIDDMSGLFVGMAENNLQDVRDSIRGLRTSYGGIESAIDKYLNRMQGKLEAKSEDRMIFVNGEIENYKSQMKQAQDDCKDGIKSDVWNIHTVVLKSENQNLKDLANMSIDNYNEYASNCRKMIDDKFDLVIDEVKKLEDWNELDYNETFHVVKSVGLMAAEVATICLVPGGVLIVAGVQGGMTYNKMKSHGYSTGQAATGGVALLASGFVLGKAGEALGSSACKFASEALKGTAGGAKILASSVSKKLTSSKLSSEWAEKMLKNNEFLVYIEGKADGIEISRYIKGDNFIKLENKFNKEFDNIVQFDKLSSDDVLKKYIKLTDNYNNSLEWAKELNTDISANIIAKLEKVGKGFNEHGEFDWKIDLSKREFDEATKEVITGKTLDEIVERIDSNQDSLGDEIRVQIEKSFAKGLESA